MIRDLLRKLWWGVTGRCTKCGGETYGYSRGFVSPDWVVQCSSCRHTRRWGFE